MSDQPKNNVSKLLIINNICKLYWRLLKYLFLKRLYRSPTLPLYFLCHLKKKNTKISQSTRNVCLHQMFHSSTRELRKTALVIVYHWVNVCLSEVFEIKIIQLKKHWGWKEFYTAFHLLKNLYIFLYYILLYILSENIIFSSLLFTVLCEYDYFCQLVNIYRCN